jgi:glycosyltransferase involved in cell wall biosynthesis
LNTGYANQTKLFVPRIKDLLGYPIAISAFWGLNSAVIEWHGIKVYPSGHQAYSQDVVTAHAAHQGAHIALTLMDAWVCQPQFYGHGVRHVPWFPVDSEPLPQGIAQVVNQSFQPIVFSRFGERVCHEAGIETMYVPHGTDTTVFHPADRASAREALNLPKDAYIVAMVAANKGNPSRKAFVEQLIAFKMLKTKHPDALLYLHTTTGARGELGGENLLALCEHLGLRIGPDVVFADQYTMLIGFSDVYMNAVYNAADLYMNVAKGEGFGIGILEAQAAGCPVLVGDWTAMSELCFSGWKVDKTDTIPWWNGLNTFQFIPRPEAIYEQLEAAYAVTNPALMRQAARQGALEYDADLVTDVYWRPVLASIQERIFGDATERAA